MIEKQRRTNVSLVTFGVCLYHEIESSSRRRKKKSAKQTKSGIIHLQTIEAHGMLQVYGNKSFSLVFKSTSSGRTR